MSYEKTVWTKGDIITSEKLNKIEEGIAGGTLVIGGFSYDGDAFTGTSDKTWQEIDDALVAGVRCIVVTSGNSLHRQFVISGSEVYNGEYSIYDNGIFNATTTSADGYPSTGSSTPPILNPDDLLG